MSRTESELLVGTEVANMPKLRVSMARFWRDHRQDPAGVGRAAMRIWECHGSPDGLMARMGAAIVLGPTAAHLSEAEHFLIDVCADDPDWRAQEALAKALDWLCDERGWQPSVELLDRWLRHFKTNVRRAAAEGPRVWTRHDYFHQRPEQAVELLGLARNDSSDYVCKSVGNSLSDISKDRPDLVLDTLGRWLAEGPVARTVLRQATRKTAQRNPKRTEQLLNRV